MKKLYNVTVTLTTELYMDIDDINYLEISKLDEFDIIDVEFEEIDDDELEMRKGDELYDMISENADEISNIYKQISSQQSVYNEY